MPCCLPLTQVRDLMVFIEARQTVERVSGSEGQGELAGGTVLPVPVPDQAQGGGGGAGRGGKGPRRRR